MVKLCELAEKENKTVYFLGGISKEMLGKMVEKLKVKFPKLKIAGFNSGPWIDFIKVEGENKIFAESNANDQAIDDIIMSAPDILFVGFGHEKQEKWIAEHLRDLPSVKIIMGVGGSFDYLSDTVARAPCFLRKIGLEWLYRLIIQPWRFKRILKAIFIFPLLVVKEKL
jgi:N-acetylglucosaminyldiphosphoundecaprenol N-acetyl-beta-D-mannosaminyltransferase